MAIGALIVDAGGGRREGEACASASRATGSGRRWRGRTTRARPAGRVRVSECRGGGADERRRAVAERRATLRSRRRSATLVQWNVTLRVGDGAPFAGASSSRRAVPQFCARRNGEAEALRSVERAAVVERLDPPVDVAAARWWSAARSRWSVPSDFGGRAVDRRPRGDSRRRRASRPAEVDERRVDDGVVRRRERAWRRCASAHGSGRGDVEGDRRRSASAGSR